MNYQQDELYSWIQGSYLYHKLQATANLKVEEILKLQSVVDIDPSPGLTQLLKSVNALNLINSS